MGSANTRTFIVPGESLKNWVSIFHRFLDGPKSLIPRIIALVVFSNNHALFSFFSQEETRGTGSTS